MSVRTDLAIESDALQTKILPEGVELTINNVCNLKIERVTVITDKGAEILGKPKGKYITITMPSFSSSSILSEEENAYIAREMSALLPIDGTVLVVGLGNVHITPDAIGPKAVDLILATRHMTELAPKPLKGFRSVAAIAPGVLGQTGVETAEVIFSLCEKIKPKAIIAIDALAAHSVTRLGCTLQISDTGISPGAGVQNRRKELSFSTLGVPVIAVGIPTVVDGAIIAGEIYDNMPQKVQGEPMMVTPRDIDLIIERGSRAIAMVINLALQSGLTQSDIVYLTC